MARRTEITAGFRRRMSRDVDRDFTSRATLLPGPMYRLPTQRRGPALTDSSVPKTLSAPSLVHGEVHVCNQSALLADPTKPSKPAHIHTALKANPRRLVYTNSPSTTAIGTQMRAAFAALERPALACVRKGTTAPTQLQCSTVRSGTIVQLDHSSPIRALSRVPARRQTCRIHLLWRCLSKLPSLCL